MRIGESAMSIVKRSASEIRKRGGGRVDWKRVRSTTDREIAAQIASDPDTAPDMSRLKGLRRVYNPPIPDVKAIRNRLGLSQSAFAGRFGFSVRTVQQWEQGRAVPDRPARILLRLIETAPQAVEEALSVQD
jgi:putative transcriptional regulator